MIKIKSKLTKTSYISPTRYIDYMGILRIKYPSAERGLIKNIKESNRFLYYKLVNLKVKESND